MTPIPDPSTFYVLLIGINDYLSPKVLNLSGCVNDVEIVAQLLQDTFQVPPDNLTLLTNAQATHVAIKTAFRTHFIARAQAWAETGKKTPAPAFLFYYSGHGSRAPDAIKPGGMDETLVPHDSRTEGIYDIKDWEIGLLLDELTDYGVDNVTLIMDCCHSGSITRTGTTPPPANARRCEEDMRPQPAKNPQPSVVTRSGGSNHKWKSTPSYVLLAACRNIEEAYEDRWREGQAWRRHGALTYFLVKELGRDFTARPLTYREVHERVQARVTAVFDKQTPQCEGDKDRLLFGGLRPQRDIFLRVADISQGYFWVDGGLAHGLTEGSLLQVYPPRVRTKADAGQALAVLEVEEPGAVRSGCVVKQGQAAVPLHARAVIQHIRQGKMRRPVLLDLADNAVRAQLAARFAQADAEPYIEVTAEAKLADFRVQALNGELYLQDREGTLLVAPTDDLDELTADLTHLVRFHNALELTGPRHADLSGKIKLVLKRLAYHPDTQEPMAVDFAPADPLVVKTDEDVVLAITNDDSQPLYFTVLDLSYDWSVSQIYPRERGTHEQLAAGKTFFFGLSRRRGERVYFDLPPEIPAARQVIKVIATVDETDFEILQQGALKTPFVKTKTVHRDTSRLALLFQQAMFGQPVRGALQYREGEADDQWTTAQLDFQIWRGHPLA